MWVASLRTTAAVSLVFVLGIGDAGRNDTITKLGSWLGLAAAVAAWYASFAGVTGFTFGREVLPERPLQRAGV